MSMRWRAVQSILWRHRRLRPILPRGYHAYPFPGGWIYLDLRESPTMLARALWAYEPHKVATLRRCLPPSGVFVDVGANKGDFSLIAARHLAGTGRVLAVEPGPDNLHWLARSIERNGYDTIEVIAAAMGPANGEQPLYLGPRSGLHSLVDRGMTVEAVPVPVRRLDDVLDERGVDRVHVLKIDVEGGEQGVLAGAERLLAADSPLVVMVDLHPDVADVADVCATLQASGFELRQPRSIDRPLPAVRPDLREVVAVRGRLPL